MIVPFFILNAVSDKLRAMRRFGLIVALFIVFASGFLAFPVQIALAEPAEGSNINITCESLGTKTEIDSCNNCMGDTTDPGAWTAIGCIHTNPNDLLTQILKPAIGMAGGIAFLLILFGGLQIMTSAGNPEQLNAGRELISSAVTGLLLIIFSIFILQFIGVQIIGIPGFG